MSCLLRILWKFSEEHLINGITPGNVFHALVIWGSSPPALITVISVSSFLCFLDLCWVSLHPESNSSICSLTNPAWCAPAPSFYPCLPHRGYPLLIIRLTLRGDCMQASTRLYIQVKAGNPGQLELVSVSPGSSTCLYRTQSKGHYGSGAFQSTLYL